MTTPVRFLSVVIFSVASLTWFVGCSKEAREAANVDVQAQIALLQGEDADARMNACIELAKAGPKAAPAVSALIPLLKDGNADVRRLAAYALMEIGPAAKEALPTLEAMMQDPNMAVVGQVANTLRAIDPEKYRGMQAPRPE